ncbi:MAG: ParA family protein [Planctomycetaceae bacterium]
MAVISAANLKGGVGKSSLVIHAAGALAKRGRKLLLVDNDPQASLTAGFLGVEATWDIAPGATIAAVHAGDEPYPEAVIRPSGIAGIDLLSGSRHATRFNAPVPEESPYEGQVRLRDFLVDVKGRYDLVLIDNPPNLHLATYSSLVASDFYLVPVQPEDFGSQGLAAVNQSAALVKDRINPDLQLLGIVLTMYTGRRAVHRMYEERLRLGFGTAVFDAAMPEAVDYVEALVSLRPVSHHKPRGAAAKAMDAIAGEILGRLSDSNAGAGEAA